MEIIFIFFSQIIDPTQFNAEPYVGTVLVAA